MSQADVQHIIEMTLIENGLAYSSFEGAHGGLARPDRRAAR